ncbi:MAG: hypothetical protein H6821_12150 [Planctomycetaceae bacterium]|nr:hypothetical protein [Planctomycetaceae bacterium]
MSDRPSNTRYDLLTHRLPFMMLILTKYSERWPLVQATSPIAAGDENATGNSNPTGNRALGWRLVANLFNRSSPVTSKPSSHQLQYRANRRLTVTKMVRDLSVRFK